MTETWTEISKDMTSAQIESLFACTRGSYQHNLLSGSENLSGSTLWGEAARWRSRYRESRENLLRRVRAAGFGVSERVGHHNRRILVIEGIKGIA